MRGLGRTGTWEGEHMVMSWLKQWRWEVDGSTASRYCVFPLCPVASNSASECVVREKDSVRDGEKEQRETIKHQKSIDYRIMTRKQLWWLLTACLKLSIIEHFTCIEIRIRHFWYIHLIRYSYRDRWGLYFLGWRVTNSIYLLLSSLSLYVYIQEAC